MKENALVLNEADKTLMYLVGCDEGASGKLLPRQTQQGILPEGRR